MRDHRSARPDSAQTRLLPLVLILLMTMGLAPASGAAPTTASTSVASDADALVAEAAAEGVAMAGVASVDASWHLGASGGQFAATAAPASGEFVDPHGHAVRKQPTQEIGSRILTRALVVEGVDGNRVAVVGNDLYLPNDLLNRRVGQLVQHHDLRVAAGLAEGPTVGLTDEQIAVTVSHNHNSPFYSSPAWGTWLFQDVMDIRFFDYYAEAMAKAVIDAAADMRPVEMGAVTIPFNEIASHTYGPELADDGTPAGQPQSHTTGQMSVVRFDEVLEDGTTDPYAAWVIFGVHPEWTWGYDVYNGDITHAAMRVIDRELGVTSVMSQRETGGAGPHKDMRVHDHTTQREYQDNGFANLDFAARLWADRVKLAYRALDENTSPIRMDHVHQPIGNTPDKFVPDALIPMRRGFDIDSASMRFAPPTSRPVPTVSSCNTQSLFHGDVSAPFLGLPGCENGGLDSQTRPIAEQLGLPQVYADLKEAGVPVPDSYGAPSLTAVEETAAVHVMAMRLGGLAVTFCPCEQFADTALNVQTRLDRTADNIWIGWDWEAWDRPDGTPWCQPVEDDPSLTQCAVQRQNNSIYVADPVPTSAVDRMRAQIRNDAAGWETDVDSLFGESEAADPADILGNFTHVEVPASDGYDMVVSVGMANDYFGYVPNYREMRAHDHYRKALNGLGLHGSDFLANRMVGLAWQLNGGPAVEPSADDLAYQAESGRALALSTTLGEIANAHEAAYAASLPADGGSPQIITEPDSIQRFDAAVVQWVGGSNYTDLPHVEVQRRIDSGDDEWVTVGDMNGEVQARVDFPTPVDLPAVEAGQFEWIWSATFEAFVHGLHFDDDGMHVDHGQPVWLPEANGDMVTATPVGDYRFTISGEHRAGPGDDVRPYELTSGTFRVDAYDGIPVDVTVEDGAAIVTVGEPTTFTIGEQDYTFGPIDYPNSYDSPLDYIGLVDKRDNDMTATGGRVRFHAGKVPAGEESFYCPFCSFRPWLDTGDAETVDVTITRADGTVATVAASPQGDGRWVADADLAPGDTVTVSAGAVLDAWGNHNAESTSVTIG